MNDSIAPDLGSGDAPESFRESSSSGAPHTRNRSHDHRTSARGPNRHPRAHSDRCVALVDARFWSWLQEDGPSEPEANLPAMAEMLRTLVGRQGGGHLGRIYWYTEAQDPRPCSGVVVRRVLTQSQDNGLSLIRAMAQDLEGLAAAQGADRAVLVSDDDRLILAVDQAQRAGLMVDMVVDETSEDLNALRRDDANWACLLSTCDRLLVIGGASREPSPRQRAPMGEGREPRDLRARREGPSAEAAGLIEDEVLRWWDEENDPQREHWRFEVQGSRGIPQELDRQMLLRISRRMGQALSPAEKTAMRAMVRRQVLGGAADEGADAPALMTTADA